MRNGKPPGPAARSALEFASLLPFSDEARKLVRPGLTGRTLFEALQQRLPIDAIHLLPQLLSRQAAVWWGCLCVWQAYRPAPEAQAAAALQTAVRWVQEPGETTRRAAETAGMAVGADTAPGCLALASFWSGGSLSRPGLPVVPPPPDLTARGVSAAVLLAAVAREPQQYEQHYRQFLALGVAVARGHYLWTSAGRLPWHEESWRPAGVEALAAIG